jgi:hypothetical protein
MAKQSHRTRHADLNQIDTDKTRYRAGAALWLVCQASRLKTALSICWADTKDFRCLSPTVLTSSEGDSRL